MKPAPSLRRRPPTVLLRALAMRFALALALWAMLTEGSLDGWAMGVAAAVTASLAGTAAAGDAGRWKALPTLAYVPAFLWQSVRGGVDVAVRALHPRMPIDPTMIDHPVRLPTEASRLVLAGTVSLLPGSLCAGLGGGSMAVHVLDRAQPVQRQLEAEERRIARLFAPEAGRG